MSLKNSRGSSMVEVLLAMSILAFVVSTSTQYLGALRVNSQHILPALQSLQTLSLVARTAYLGLSSSEIAQLTFDLGTSVDALCESSVRDSIEHSRCTLTDQRAKSPILLGTAQHPLSITIIREVTE